jgi:serine/threonine-protein kinase haspin
LKTPRKPKSSEDRTPPISETAFSEKDCYDCLVDMENWLGKTIAETIPSGGKPLKSGRGKRKTHAPSKTPSSSSGPARAGEVVTYGVKKGWIQPSVLF